MPYEIRNGNCVAKKGGAVVKCHKTAAEAKAHLRALYANVEDAKEMKLTPKDVSTKYLAEKNYLYAGEEAWTFASAVSALGLLNDIVRSEAYDNEALDVKEMTSIMRQLLRFMTSQLDEVDNAMDEEFLVYKEAKSNFTIEKDANDKLRWILFTSSAFEDKDGEIIAEKALQRDCDQMELTGDYGELLWWHCDGDVHAALGEKDARPYIPLGKCDFSAVSNKINIESGTFYDEAVGQKILEKAGKLGASKSFWHDQPQDNVYHSIRTKERSIMFRPKESNFLTRLFNGSKE